jgi:hypothetical protein
MHLNNMGISLEVSQVFIHSLFVHLAWLLGTVLQQHLNIKCFLGQL